MSEYSNSLAVFICRPAKQFLRQVHASAHHSAFHDQMIDAWLANNSEVQMAAAIINRDSSLIGVVFVTDISPWI